MYFIYCLNRIVIVSDKGVIEYMSNHRPPYVTTSVHVDSRARSKAAETVLQGEYS